MGEPRTVTRVLQGANQGDARAKDELLRLLYEELHSIAEKHMRTQPPGHTLQPTALVNEAYMRLFRRQRTFGDRAHFLRSASHAMRWILTDHARSKRRAKREAGGEQVPLEALAAAYEESVSDLVLFDEALEKLSSIDPRLVEVVELHLFGGRTFAEIAEILGVSLSTVQRDWRVARAWLKRELG